MADPIRFDQKPTKKFSGKGDFIPVVDIDAPLGVLPADGYGIKKIPAGTILRSFCDGRMHALDADNYKGVHVPGAPYTRGDIVTAPIVGGAYTADFICCETGTLLSPPTASTQVAQANAWKIFESAGGMAIGASTCGMGVSMGNGNMIGSSDSVASGVFNFAGSVINKDTDPGHGTITNISGAICVYRGVWDISTSYKTGGSGAPDAVFYEGYLYTASSDSTGSEPGVSGDWNPLDGSYSLYDEGSSYTTGNLVYKDFVLDLADGTKITLRGFFEGKLLVIDPGLQPYMSGTDQWIIKYLLADNCIEFRLQGTSARNGVEALFIPGRPVQLAVETNPSFTVYTCDDMLVCSTATNSKGDYCTFLTVKEPDGFDQTSSFTGLAGNATFSEFGAKVAWLLTGMCYSGHASSATGIRNMAIGYGSSASGMQNSAYNPCSSISGCHGWTDNAGENVNASGYLGDFAGMDPQLKAYIKEFEFCTSTKIAAVSSGDLKVLNPLPATLGGLGVVYTDYIKLKADTLYNMKLHIMIYGEFGYRLRKGIKIIELDLIIDTRLYGTEVVDSVQTEVYYDPSLKYVSVTGVAVGASEGGWHTLAITVDNPLADTQLLCTATVKGRAVYISGSVYVAP